MLKRFNFKSSFNHPDLSGYIMALVWGCAATIWFGWAYLSLWIVLSR